MLKPEVACLADSILAQCLVGCAMLRESDLINEKENSRLKMYLFSEQDSVKLFHLSREFESTGCLRKFRDSIAGFMGDPSIGYRKSRGSHLASPRKLSSNSNIIKKLVTEC